MGFFGLIPYAVVGGFCAIAFFWGRTAVKKYGRRLERIQASPLVEGGQVAGHVGGVCKFYGKLIAPNGTLESPIDGVNCVWYRLVVEEQRTRTVRDINNKAQKEKVWVSILDASKMVPCGIADRDGAIEVSLAEADMLVEDRAKKQSGLFNDVPVRLRKLIEEEYGRDTGSEDWFGGKKKLRIKEQVLEVGENALVVGKVKLVRSDRGVRPRFVRGKEPLLVTDKDDQGLIGHYRWSVVRGRCALFGGAGVGVLSLLGFLWILFGATTAALHGTGKGNTSSALAELRHPNDKWRRIRAMEPYEKGPGGLGGEAGQIKKAILERLAEEDPDVSLKAAAVLPAWVEKEDVPALVGALGHKQDGVRRAAIKMLAGLKDPAAGEALAAAFDKDPDLVSDALKAVGADPKPVAAKHLFSPNGRVREAALELTAGLPKEEFEGLAAANVFSPNEGIRNQAALVLKDSPRRAKLLADQAVEAVKGDAGAEQDLALDWLNRNRPAVTERASELRGPLLGIVRGGKGRMPQVAADLLVLAASKEQAAELSKLAVPKNPVARQAIAALGRVGGPEEAFALAMLILDRDLWGDASRALRVMKPDGEAGLLKFLREKAYAKNKNAATEACRILEVIGTSAALPTLEELAKEKDRTLNSAAKKAAAAIKKRE